MKNLATKKKTKIKTELTPRVQPMHPDGSTIYCASVKRAVRANMAMRPFLLLTFLLRTGRKGMVANCDSPLMIPLIKILLNSCCRSKVGP